MSQPSPETIEKWKLWQAAGGWSPPPGQATTPAQPPLAIDPGIDGSPVRQPFQQRPGWAGGFGNKIPNRPHPQWDDGMVRAWMEAQGQKLREMMEKWRTERAAHLARWQGPGGYPGTGR